MLIGKYNWEDALDKKLAKEKHSEFTDALVNILSKFNERIYRNSVDIIELQNRQKKMDKQLKKIISQTKRN